MSQTELIPFGKFKGQPVTQLEHDPQYAQWILSTPSIKDKFPRFYSIVVNNFGEPADSPEHNAFQAMFLDEWFSASVAMKISGKCDLNAVNEAKKKSYQNEARLINNENKSHYWPPHGGPRPDTTLEFLHLSCDMEFEVNGWDVILKPVDTVLVDGNPKRLGHINTPKFIELKPSIGEDFPAILRQVKQRLAGLRKLDAFQVCVIIREFTAESVSLENVKKMFALSRIQLLMLSEIPLISESQFKML